MFVKKLLSGKCLPLGLWVHVMPVAVRSQPDLAVFWQWPQGPAMVPTAEMCTAQCAAGWSHHLYLFHHLQKLTGNPTSQQGRPRGLIRATASAVRNHWRRQALSSLSPCLGLPVASLPKWHPLLQMPLFQPRYVTLGSKCHCRGQTSGKQTLW